MPARWSYGIVAVMLAGLAAQPAAAASLQEMIDAAKPNDTITLPAGTYHEHLVITKPLTLDGASGVIIDGDGKGTVVEIATDGATIKGLTLRNSGTLHNQIDAGLRIKGNFNVVKDVTITNSLFGIDLHQANNNVLRRNHISSDSLPLGLRGDSIRLWYSANNEISSNVISDARDFVVWYSHDNTITDNKITRSRYGVHFMYGNTNVLEGNEITDCVVGVFLMYSNEVQLRKNHILRAWGASGMGVGLKDSSDTIIEDNDIAGNAMGISFDLSPSDPETPNIVRGNRLSFNGIGVSFVNDWEGNEMEGNMFTSNFTQVAVGGGGTALREAWKNNYWDDYSGFDSNGDGHGDAPYEIYNYADRLWMEVPPAAFFRGAPAMEMLDFVERLAPFSEPRLLVKETDPLVEAPVVADAGSAKPKSALEMLQQ